MEKRQFITIRSHNSNNEIIVEVPNDEAIYTIISDLLKVMNWPQKSGDQLLSYYLEDEKGKILDSTLSFSQIELDNFDVLWLTLDKNQGPTIASKDEKILERIPGAQTLDLETSNEDFLPAPTSYHLNIDKPCLIYNNTLIFPLPLNSNPILIGRKGSNSDPQIDLTAIDNGLFVSHRHAEVLFIHNSFAIHTLKTKNGMLLNGAMLKPDDTILLNDGDELQFGFRGVKLTFRTPNSTNSPQ